MLFTTLNQYMKNWVYKTAYSLLVAVLCRWKAIFSTCFAIIGVIFTISEILDNVFGRTDGYDFMREYTIPGLVAIFFVSTVLNRKRLTYSCFVGNTDIKITLCVCDIFSKKGALIIPTNTTFDTQMEGEFISVKSVQGQYQERYYHNELLKLNQDLSAELQNREYTLINDDRLTNNKRYSIGTTCKITRKTQHDYFLAVADVNKHGKTENVSLENITQALVSLWYQLNTFGHVETIRIPLIGTGRGGLKESRDRILQETIFTFIVAAKDMKITEHLIICIHPMDFVNKNLHWDDLCEYLNYTCKYHNLKQGNPEGSPESDSDVNRRSFLNS